MLFAIYATPKLQPYAVLYYAIAVFVVFALKGYAVLTLGIHGLNCVLFYVCARFLFAAKTQSTLLLTDDERLVLDELAAGKLQKQIEAFSPNKVTKVIKNAQERNHCKTKTELLHRYIKENESQTAANESHD